MLSFDIQFVLTLLAIMVAILLLLLGYLIIRKVKEIRSERRVAGLIRMYEPAVRKYLQSGEASKLLSGTKSRSVSKRAIELLLAEMTELLDGDTVRERVRSFAEEVLADDYRNRLRHRRWSIRMNALRRIEEFRMLALRGELERLLYEETRTLTNAEKFELCKILCMFEDERLLSFMAANKLGFSDFQKRSLLSHMNGSMFDGVEKDFAEIPAEWQYAVVDVIGIQRLEAHIPFLRKLLGDGREELRIRSLKSLSRMSLLGYDEAFVRHASSPSWQERMMAAKLFGSSRSRYYLSALQPMLSDTSWWVRSQAAESMLGIPGGRQLLEESARHSDDAFARDIAAEWLEKGEFHESLG